MKCRSRCGESEFWRAKVSFLAVQSGCWVQGGAERSEASLLVLALCCLHTLAALWGVLCQWRLCATPQLPAQGELLFTACSGHMCRGGSRGYSCLAQWAPRNPLELQIS